MLPAMQHHAAWAQVAIRLLQAIKPISHTVTTLIPLGNKGTTERRKVRALLVGKLGIARAHVRLLSTTTMAHRTREYRSTTFEAPRNKAPTTRVARHIDKESNICVVTLLATKLT